MRYDNKVIWMFDKHPFYIAIIQDSQGKLIAIEIEETDEQQNQTQSATDD